MGIILLMPMAECFCAPVSYNDFKSMSLTQFNLLGNVVCIDAFDNSYSSISYINRTINFDFTLSVPAVVGTSAVTGSISGPSYVNTTPSHAIEVNNNSGSISLPVSQELSQNVYIYRYYFYDGEYVFGTNDKQDVKGYDVTSNYSFSSSSISLEGTNFSCLGKKFGVAAFSYDVYTNYGNYFPDFKTLVPVASVYCRQDVYGKDLMFPSSSVRFYLLSEYLHSRSIIVPFVDFIIQSGFEQEPNFSTIISISHSFTADYNVSTLGVSQIKKIIDILNAYALDFHEYTISLHNDIRYVTDSYLNYILDNTDVIRSDLRQIYLLLATADEYTSEYNSSVISFGDSIGSYDSAEDYFNGLASFEFEFDDSFLSSFNTDNYVKDFMILQLNSGNKYIDYLVLVSLTFCLIGVIVIFLKRL